VARILLVGCGCRGQALAAALAAEGHVVRGTTRDPARAGAIEAAGAEAVVADPDRLGMLMAPLAGVSVLCWLMGSAAVDALHGDRLQGMLEHIVDTPVRGIVYEAAGSAGPELLARGAALVRDASARWRISAEVVTAEPAERDAWLAAMTKAVEHVLR
jgi:nucleoside-diphosphate-sugar epimerase